MKAIEIQVTENDILKSIKNTKYSPMHHAAARHLKEPIDTIDIQKHAILIWNSDDSDYKSYKYEDVDIKNVKLFLEEWEDLNNNYIENFCSSPFVFRITQNR